MKQEIKGVVEKFLNNQSIAYDLIQYFKQEDFEQEIIQLADRAVEDSFKFELPAERKALVVVAITVIAIRYYDGNLWEHIRRLFSNTYNGDHDLKADAKIRSMLQLFKKDCKYTDAESLVAVPLIAAGVTHYWLQPFFDFCFAIYKANLLSRRNIGETELRQELLNTFEAMKIGNYLSDKEDIIRIGKSHSYKLSKFTQSALLTGTNLDGISNIGTYCVKSIIKCLNNEPFKIHPYYKEAFESWKKHFYSNKSERNKLTDSGNWNIKIKYNNSKFFLITKTEKIPEATNPDKVVLQLLENGIVVSETSDVSVGFAIGGFLVGSTVLEIPCSLLNKISYRLVEEDKILFDSKDKIYKNNDVFFFDDKGNQINSNVDFDGVLTVITKTEIDSKYTIKKEEDYFVSELKVTPSGSYMFDGNIYSFKTIRKPGVDGELVSGVLAHTNIDGKNYEIYNTIPSLLIETRLDKQQLYLVIDNRIVESFDSINYPVLDNGVRQYKILLPAPMSKGWHLVYVNSKVTSKPIFNGKFEFVYDDSFQKKVTVCNNICKIHLISSFVTDIKDIEYGVSCVDFRCTVPGRGTGNLKVNPEVVSLCFVDKWLRDGDRVKYSRIKDGSHMIRLNGSKNMKARAITTKTILDLQIYSNKDNDSDFLLDIGPALALKESGVHSVRIAIENETYFYNIYIDFVTFIDVAKSVYRYDHLKDYHYFNFVYDEDKKIMCSILDVSLNKIVYSTSIHSNVAFYPKNIRAFTNYKVVFSEKGDGMFAKEVIICELPYFFIDSKDLVGRVFEIDAIEIYDGNNKLVKKNIRANGTTLKIFSVNRNDNNSFVGNLKRIECGYDQLKQLGLLKVSTDSEFEGDEIWIYICDLKDEDLLLYDNKKSQICGTNQINSETKTFPGIERYLIKVR